MNVFMCACLLARARNTHLSVHVCGSEQVDQDEEATTERGLLRDAHR